MKYFRPKKRFGQHFLNDKRLVKKIVRHAKIEDEVVIEIGAGKGVLTKYIAQKAKKVIAVEIDRNLIEILKKSIQPNVVIINEDFLKLDLRNFPRAVIVGNIPYSISTYILEMLVAQRDYFKRALFTLQKEYAQRLLAKVGSRQYGSITLYINYYYHIKRVFTIPAKYFTPPPNVNSFLISLLKKKPLLKLDDEIAFFEFVKGIFRYRRKSLKNAIGSYLNRLPDGIDETLLKKRPQNLTLKDFYSIYSLL